MNCEGQEIAQTAVEPTVADRWILARQQQMLAAIHEGYAQYRFDQVARALYEFVWDEYCDWYLELAKVQIGQGGPIAANTRRILLEVLESTLRAAHPLIPFVTEELWQAVRAVQTGQPETDTLMRAAFPLAGDNTAAHALDEFKLLANACRALRSGMGLPPGQKVPLVIEGDACVMAYAPYLQALARLESVSVVARLPADSDAPVEVVGPYRLMLLIEVDREAEIARLDKEIARLTGEISKCDGKLSNTSFVDRAPAAVVEQERTRLDEFKTTLEKVKTQRARL